MIRLHGWIVVGLAAAACGNKESASSSGSGSAGSAGSSAAGSAITAAKVVAVPADAAAPPAEPIAAATVPLPEIKAGTGLILTDPAGGKAEVKLAGGKTIEIADGTMAVLTDNGFGPLNEPTREIVVDGKTGRVAAANVLATYEVKVATATQADGGAAIRGEPRSPSGGYQVATAELDCGDACRGALWLLHGANQHWLLVAGSALPTVTWRPDGGALAYDGDSPYVEIVALPQMTRTKIDAAISPAYSPTGTLYVRGVQGEVYEVTGTAKKQVGKGRLAAHDPDEAAQSNGPVVFDASGAWKLPANEKPAHKGKKHNRVQP